MQNLLIIFLNVLIIIFSLFWFSIKLEDFKFYITHPLKRKKDTFLYLFNIIVATTFVFFMFYWFITQWLKGSIDFTILGVLFFITTIIQGIFFALEKKGHKRLSFVPQIISLMFIILTASFFFFKLMPLWEQDILTNIREYNLIQEQKISKQKMIEKYPDITKFNKIPDTFYRKRANNENENALSFVRNHFQKWDHYVVALGIINIKNNTKKTVEHELVHYNINKSSTIKQAKVYSIANNIKNKTKQYLKHNSCSEKNGRFCIELKRHNDLIEEEYFQYGFSLEEYIAYGYNFVNDYEKNELEDPQLKELYSLYQEAFNIITK